MSMLQNEDFKTLAQLTGAGGSASQLLNDTKVYVTAGSINKQLSQAITDRDILSGDVVLTSEVTGVLPVANGGTNSSSALSNNRVMRSSGGAITEAAAITSNRALISDTNGIPTHSSVTNTELGYVSGVTSAIQTQLGAKAASGANSDITSLSGLTTALSIGQGGTGQTTANAAFNALAPSQTSNANRYLRTDGTNTSWVDLNASTNNSNWIDAGAITITGTTTNPTKGTTSRDKIFYRRNGPNLDIRVEYRQTSAGTAGSGDYLITVPGGFSIDTTVLNLNTVIGADSATQPGIIGDAVAAIIGVAAGDGYVSPYSSTQFRIITQSSASAGIRSVGSAWFDLGATNTMYSANFSLPIVGFGPAVENTNAAKKIGYDHTTATNLAAGANDLHAFRVFATTDAQLTRLGIFLSSNAAGKNYVLGIYADNGSGLPGSKLGQTNQQTTANLPGGTVDGGYKTFALQSPVSLTAGTAYWLSFHSSSVFTVENAFNVVATGSQKYRNIAYSSTLPATFGTPTGDAGGGGSLGGF